MRNPRPKLIKYEYMLFFANYDAPLSAKTIRRYNELNESWNEHVQMSIRNNPGLTFPKYQTQYDNGT